MSKRRFATIAAVVVALGCSWGSAREDGGAWPLTPNVVGRMELVAELRERLATAELSVWGTVVEEYSEVYGLYPGKKHHALTVVESLEIDRHEEAFATLPLTDPWGTPYSYWVDDRGYFIVSFGPDRRPAIPYGSFTPEKWDTLCPHADDLVYVNGAMCRPR